jgi:hypothetical protein
MRFKVWYKKKMLRKGGIINSIECKTRYILTGIGYKNKFKLSLKRFKKSSKMLMYYSTKLQNFGKTIGKLKKDSRKF